MVITGFSYNILSMEEIMSKKTLVKKESEVESEIIIKSPLQQIVVRVLVGSVLLVGFVVLMDKLDQDPSGPFWSLLDNTMSFFGVIVVLGILLFVVIGVGVGLGYSGCLTILTTVGIHYLLKTLLGFVDIAIPIIIFFPLMIFYKWLLENILGIDCPIPFIDPPTEYDKLKRPRMGGPTGGNY